MAVHYFELQELRESFPTFCVRFLWTLFTEQFLLKLYFKSMVFSLNQTDYARLINSVHNHWFKDDVNSLRNAWCNIQSGFTSSVANVQIWSKFSRSFMADSLRFLYLFHVHTEERGLWTQPLLTCSFFLVRPGYKSFFGSFLITRKVKIFSTFFSANVFLGICNGIYKKNFGSDSCTRCIRFVGRVSLACLKHGLPTGALRFFPLIHCHIITISSFLLFLFSLFYAVCIDTHFYLRFFSTFFAVTFGSRRQKSHLLGFTIIWRF